MQEQVVLFSPILSEVEINCLHWSHLQDFKLTFGHHQGRTSSIWHGGTATIVQSPGDEVWGIVWKLSASNISSLDKQEGVEDGIYVPIEVNVHTYQMKDYVCGPPSPQYKKVGIQALLFHKPPPSPPASCQNRSSGLFKESIH
uniref:gamma-glutamylcyclotransferase n=1 Tax=Meleagris gallopavo TaxID=9103 RepID=A0A803XYI7_MELGA